MAFRPITKEYVQGLQQPIQQPVPQPQPQQRYIPAPEIPIDVPQGELPDNIVTNLARNVSRSADNYIAGAVQGLAELNRAQREAERVMVDYATGGNVSPEDYKAAREYEHRAAKTFTDETIAPVVIPAAVVNPALAPAALGIVGGQLMESTKQGYEKDSVPGALKAAIGDITGVNQVMELVNQPDLAQQFYENPATVGGNAAMALAGPFLMGRSAYKGAKGYVNKRLGEVDNALNIESMKGVQGLDALDQYDSPTRGFRPATPDEMRTYNAEQLQGGRGELARALEQIKAKKFDEANQQSYWEYMKREADQANALEAQKNQIAGEALFSPVDRLEVGLDLPSKSKLSSAYIMGEQPKGEIILPSRQVGQIIAPQQPKPQPFLRDANSFIEERSQNVLSSDLRKAVQQNDFTTAAQIAEQLGNPKLAEALRNKAPTMQNKIADVGERRSLIEEARRVREQAKIEEPAVIEQPKQIETPPVINRFTELSDKWKSSKWQEMSIDELKELRSAVKEKGDWTRDFDEDPRIRLDLAINRAEKRLLEQQSINNLVNSVPKPVRQIKEKTSPIDKTINEIVYHSEQAGMKNITYELTKQKYDEMLSRYGEEKANEALKATLKSFKDKAKENENKLLTRAKGEIFEKHKSVPTANRAVKEEIIKGTYDNSNIPAVNEYKAKYLNKLQSGFDPTGGRFDDMTVGDVARKLMPEKKDRIIDNNDSTPNTSVKEMLDKAYQRTIDSLSPIKKYSNDAYMEARMSSGRAVGRAEEMLKRPDMEGSFESIVSPVKGRLDDFAEYVAALRAAELHQNGVGTGISNERIAKILQEAPDEFKTAQAKLTAYSDRLLDVLVDGGVITPDHVAAMRAKYQNYAPMMRAFEVTDIDQMFSKKGFDVRNPIQRIEGSAEKIINPLESIIKNTYTFNLLAEQNKVRQQIAKLAEVHPDAVQRVEGAPSAKDGIFTVYENGQKVSYQAEPRLYEALASMDSTTSSIVVRVLSQPASWLRAGATMSPEFIARNLIRDTINAAIVGKDFTPIVDTVRGLKSAWAKDDTYWQYKREGGAMGHMTALDRNHMQEALNNYKQKGIAQKAATPFNPKTWIDVLRKAQELSEDATRIGYYKKRLSKGDSPQMAAFEARDLMDFGRSGDYTREWNRISAFLNASLQGSDKLVRSMRERPLETSANIIKYLVMPSVAVWYMGKDDKRIQQLPDWQKDLFWIIPAGDTLIRIPKPFEPGVLFASGTERALSSMIGNKKDAFKGYGKSVLDVVIPNVAPTALMPIAEWWANKSFFTGQDIVPKREQNLPERLQYGTNTTGVAKAVGNALNVSPRKIDNTVRGFTGNTGANVLNAIDYGSELIKGSNGPVKPAKGFSELPVIRGFTTDPRKGSQPVQSFYDELKKYEQIEAAGKTENVKVSIKDKQNLDMLQGANKGMRELNKKEREILNSTKMNAEQKRKELDKIADQQMKLADAVLKRLKK
jgi:hypothetical protein